MEHFASSFCNKTDLIRNKVLSAENTKSKESSITFSVTKLFFTIIDRKKNFSGFYRERNETIQFMRIIKLITICLGILFGFLPLSAQESPDTSIVEGKVNINGQILPYMIDSCGDTIIMAELEDVTVTSLRKMGTTQEDWNRYRRYRRYALEVYPYAVEAIKVFRQVENMSTEMKKRERKRYIKHLQKEMKEKFKDPLMGLTKTQGLILFKMIERELDTPIYFLIKDLRNGLAATYWQTLGSFYGHNLKEGYVAGKDPILDAVLNDLDVSYEVGKD